MTLSIELCHKLSAIFERGGEPWLKFELNVKRNISAAWACLGDILSGTFGCLVWLMAEWMTPVTCGAKSKRFVAAAFTPGAFESFVCWRVWNAVNARKLRLTSDVYGSNGWLMCLPMQRVQLLLRVLPVLPIAALHAWQLPCAHLGKLAGWLGSVVNHSRCSCSTDMCALSSRAMGCVYPCHLLVFGVDKRIQLTWLPLYGKCIYLGWCRTTWRGGPQRLPFE